MLYVFIIHNAICTLYFFFFNDTATTEIYTLSLHDALPISRPSSCATAILPALTAGACCAPSHTSTTSTPRPLKRAGRSEEHTSELQSQSNLVCRLLLEKKKKKKRKKNIETNQHKKK